MSSSTTSLPANTNSHNQTPIFLLSNISTYVTVKLDHSNFQTWKFQITHILEAYSLLEYVEGYNTCPPRFLVDELGAVTTQVNSVYSQWQARDKALMSLISATLSPSAHSLIIGQSSAYGMWNVLLKRYTSVSRSNILNLKKQLHDVKKNTDTVPQYLQRIKETRDKLAAVGTLIDDEDLLHIVLKGLPSEYESFSTAMLTKSEPVSFEELHVLMITQEELLKRIQRRTRSWQWQQTKDLQIPCISTTQQGVALTIEAMVVSMVEAEAITEAVSPHGVDIIRVLIKVIKVTMPPMEFFPNLFHNPTQISQTLTPTAQLVKYATNRVIPPLIATIA
jgi:hypothetical protein